MVSLFFQTIYPDHCGDVKGTAAGFLHPDPDRKHIDFFSTDICRPIRYCNALEDYIGILYCITDLIEKKKKSQC